MTPYNNEKEVFYFNHRNGVLMNDIESNDDVMEILDVIASTKTKDG